MKKIGNANKMTREEWLDFRRAYIGGSDAAAVLGLNKYKSALAVWSEKKGLLTAQSESEATRQGRDLEAYVAARFEEETGKKVRNDAGIYIDEKRPWMGADIDRILVGESAILECKTTQNRAGYNFDRGELPPTWYVQVMHYMAVTGKERAYVAVLEFGKGFHIIPVERNEDEIAALRQAEERFWKDYVEAHVPPDPDGSESAGEAVRGINAEISEEAETVMLYDLEDDFDALDELTQQKDELTKAIEQIKQKICMEMGDAVEGTTMHWRATWKPSVRTTVDTKRLRKERPEIFAAYSTTSTTRTFKFGKIKEDIT